MTSFKESQHSGIKTTHQPECLKNSPLYNALSDWLGQPGNWAHLGHLTTCIWLVIAVIHTGSVNMTKWDAHVLCSGKFAQSIPRRIQRWLYNPRINIHRLYKPLIEAALANWKDKELFLPTSGRSRTRSFTAGMLMVSETSMLINSKSPLDLSNRFRVCAHCFLYLESIA